MCKNPAMAATMPSSPSEPHRVVVLAIAPVIGYDLTIPPQVLGEAHDEDGHPLYDVQVVSVDDRPVATSKGYAIAPSAGIEALATAQTVVVPGTMIHGPRHDGTLPDAIANPWKAMTSGGSTGRPKLILANAPGTIDSDANPLLMMQPNGTHLMPAPLYHNGPSSSLWGAGA